MKLNKNAEVVQGRKNVYTHLVIAAHQDDIEIMCGDGIVQCYQQKNKGLVAVIVSDGAGSPRQGRFADYTNKQMIAQRRAEQIRAAEEGDYAVLIMLNYPSSDIKLNNSQVIADLIQIINKYNPQIMYTHNPADKHSTHVRVLQCTLQALRNIPISAHPQSLYGCECWRGLDWLNDDDKVIFNLTGYEKLLTKLLSYHESQVEGGKRYDLAANGRRLANATFLSSHETDIMEQASFAMDLTPLIKDNRLSLKSFTISKIKRFKKSLHL